MCECHYHLRLSFFIPTPFPPLLHRILLLHVLGNVCLLRREGCLGYWDCITFLSLLGMVIVQTRAFAHIAHWVPILTIPLPFHGLVGHVGPLGLLPLFLGFSSSFTSPLLLILPIGLLAVIPTMLTHWACYLFFWASLTHLLHLYLLFFPCLPHLYLIFFPWAC